MMPYLRTAAVLLTLLGSLVTAPGTLTASFDIPPVERTKLPSGQVLLVSEEHSLPFVTIQVLIDAGSERDPAGREGLAHLTARAMLTGTGTRTATQISDVLDFLGASLDASAGRDFTTISLRVLKKDLDQGIALLADVLSAPTFPEQEVEREIEKTVAAIKSREDDPGEVAEKEFIKTLFIDNPYGHRPEGTVETVSRLTREAVVGFYRDWFRPENSILTIVGDITGQEVRTRLLPRLAGWEAAKLPPSPFKGAFTEGPKTVKVNRSITQANIILGHKGISRSDPDFYTAIVMNYILGGGGFSSRLTDAVRVKRGLAYSIASFFDYGKYPGSFQVILQTKNKSAGESISLVVTELKRMQEEAVSDAELEGAKKYLIGSFPLRLGTQSKLVNFLGQVEYYGLGQDYARRYPALIGAVTKEDIKRVALKYLHPNSYVLVVVGNLQEIGADIP